MYNDFSTNMIRDRKNQNMPVRELSRRAWIRPSRIIEIELGADATSQERYDIIKVLKSKKNN